MKKRNEKYLKQDASGTWHLNFRVPVRFGGEKMELSRFVNEIYKTIRKEEIK